MGFSTSAAESWFIAWEIVSGHFKEGATYSNNKELSIPYHVLLQG